MRRESKDRKPKQNILDSQRPKSLTRKVRKRFDDTLTNATSCNGPRNKLCKTKYDEPNSAKIKDRSFQALNTSLKVHKNAIGTVGAPVPGEYKINHMNRILEPSEKIEFMQISVQKASDSIKSNFGEEWKSSTLDAFQNMLVVDSGNNASLNGTLVLSSIQKTNEFEKLVEIELKKTNQINLTENNPTAPIKTESIMCPRINHVISDEKLNKFSNIKNNALSRANIMQINSKLDGDSGKFTIYSSNGVVKETHEDIKNCPNIGLNFTYEIDRQTNSLHNKNQPNRANDLLRIIELDFDEYRDILDLQPINKYSIYMLRFGLSGHSQVQTQTKENSVSKEAQTEHLRGYPYNSWTQAPPDDEGKYSGHEFNKNVKSHRSTTDALIQLDPILEAFSAEIYPDIASRSRASTENDLSSLSKFDLLRLKYLGNTILVLFEEQEEEKERSEKMLMHTCPPSDKRQRKDISQDRGCVQGSLGHTSLSLSPSNENSDKFFIPEHCYQDMNELECVKCEFSKACNRRLLTMHCLKVTKNEQSLLGIHFQTCDMICVWSVSDSSGQGRVERILKCPGLLPMSARAMQQTCSDLNLCEGGDGIICVIIESTEEYDVVVAGLSDGSLALWDIAASFIPPLNQSSFQQLRKSNFFQSGNDPDAPTASLPTLVPPCCPLPFIFDYAQPPDYLASQAFTESCGRVERGKQLNIHASSPIIAMQVLTKPEVLRRKDSFQFSSLDTRGRIIIWMALNKSAAAEEGDLCQRTRLAGSVTDLGLRPGSAVRLIKLANVLTEFDAPSRYPSNEFDLYDLAPFTTCLEVCRSTDTFFVGTEDGLIRQHSRVAGSPLFPIQFTPISEQVGVSVTSLALHPIYQNLLLSGYSDGRLVLYLTHRSAAIYEWNVKENPMIAGTTRVESRGIKKVIWSNHRPSVIYCLTTSGEVTAWTLFHHPHKLQEHNSPKLDEEDVCFQPYAQTLISASTHSIDKNQNQQQRIVVDFTMVDSVGFGCLAICWSDGAEVHWLEDHLTVVQDDETYLLQSIVNSIY